jgi:putative hemolysin
MPENENGQSTPRPNLLVNGELGVDIPFAGVATKLLPLKKFRALVRDAAAQSDRTFLQAVLEIVNIRYRVSPADIERVPKDGPTVVVANHPFGLLDGVILAEFLPRIRPDVKIMTNFLLGGFEEIAKYMIFVDPFERKGAKESNSKGIREALTWLKKGGMLVMFPAGEVSHMTLRGRIADPKWTEMTSRLIRATDAAALPIYFKGTNSVAFHALGLVHPRLRTVRLPHEFFKKSGKTVELRVGSPVSAKLINEFPTDEEATSYLRWRTYLLRDRDETRTQKVLQKLRPHPVEKSFAAIADAVPACELAAEVESLPAAQRLDSNRELAVYVAEAGQIPKLLNEIGRLREVTFREIGEGTGKQTDLDEFDAYYFHVFMWNREKQELVGAYRMGEIRKILAERGLDGLYTSTLFRYKKGLFERLGPAFELGRSFVRSEYQRQFTPLMLLWKGIAKVVSAHPDTPILFGPVSISGAYTRASRTLLVNFFESQQRDELAGLVKSRTPFRPRRLRGWEFRSMVHALHDVDDLSAPIGDIEPDGKGVPILVKQYVKLGGKLLGFNVDKDFANCLDGLVLVDLRKTERELLERYMGKDGTATFLKHHGIDGQTRTAKAGT